MRAFQTSKARYALAAATLATCGLSSRLFAGTYASIGIDGNFSDWTNVPITLTDPTGDGNPTDFGNIQLANDDNYLYLHVTYNTPVNPQAGAGVFLAFDTDSNTATGFNVYGLGTVGSELGYQNDFPFRQASGNFNTGDTVNNGGALIAPYAATTTDQEYAILRSATFGSDNSPIFPNTSFSLMLYTNGNPAEDVTTAIPYTFAIFDPLPNWNVIGSGDWNRAANWSSNTIPNGVDAVAKLFALPTSATTVYTNSAITLGTLSFNNANTYVIAGAGSLTMDVSTGAALIDVQQGNQKINLPLLLNKDTNVNVADAASLQIADPLTLAGGTTMSKNGNGTLTVLSTIHASAPATIKINGGVANLDAANNDPNISVNIDPATLNVGANQNLSAMTMDLGGNVLNVGRDSTGANVPAHVTLSALHVSNGGAANVINTTLANNLVIVAGSLDIQSGSKLVKQGAAALKVGSIAINSTGQLDLTDSKLAVDYSGTSPIGAVKAQIASGYAGGAWNGNGINSSVAAAAASSAHATGIGYGEASSLGLGTFGGQTMDGTDVVAGITYYGDANLDGTVTSLDFNALANNFNKTGQVWTAGDFNYDGVVNALDFNAVASNFGQTLPAPPLGSLVPEPASLAMIGFALTALAARRRWAR